MAGIRSGHRIVKCLSASRLETALTDVKELKLYPADGVDLGSETGDTLQALADFQVENGGLLRAIEIYEELLEETDPSEPDPQFDLQNAVHLSAICGLAAKAYRRAHHTERASAVEQRRLELWKRWAQKLPNNAFVRQQLTLKDRS